MDSSATRTWRGPLWISLRVIALLGSLPLALAGVCSLDTGMGSPGGGIDRIDLVQGVVLVLVALALFLVGARVSTWPFDHAARRPSSISASAPCAWRRRLWVALRGVAVLGSIPLAGMGLALTLTDRSTSTAGTGGGLRGVADVAGVAMLVLAAFLFFLGLFVRITQRDPSA